MVKSIVFSCMLILVGIWLAIAESPEVTRNETVSASFCFKILSTMTYNI